METEKEKMLQGKIYDPSDPELIHLRATAHRLSKEYNDTLEEEEEKRRAILDRLLPNRGRSCYLQGPIYFDYGVFTTIGDYFFSNFHLTVLDCCTIRIGNHVFFGPNVTLAAPRHPMLASERACYQKPDGAITDKEYAKPIVIRDHCWLASNVVVCGNVEIGEGCVIGAGSVVTKSIPPHSFAAGNPCRVIREITDQESIELQKDLF